jgi:hypothetical protein
MVSLERWFTTTARYPNEGREGMWRRGAKVVYGELYNYDKNIKISIWIEKEWQKKFKSWICAN